jgi:hypothetical protein
MKAKFQPFRVGVVELFLVVAIFSIAFCYFYFGVHTAQAPKSRSLASRRELDQANSP